MFSTIGPFRYFVELEAMIQHARLAVTVPLSHLQAETLALQQDWPSHFNLNHYKGRWTVLPLRSPGGREQQIIPDLRENEEFADTPLLAQCPVVKRVLDDLHCPKLAVRLMNLAAGALIKEHRDHDLSFEQGEARLHIPVFTNPGVEFIVNGSPVPMQEGDCWYVNVNLPHKVANNGATDRIHLVIDCKVNDWLQDLFAAAPVVETTPAPKNADLEKIIAELRLQNSETANRLAEELENQLAANDNG